MGNPKRNFIVLFDGTDARIGTNTNIQRIKDSFPQTDTTRVKYLRGTNIVTSSPLRQTLFPTEIVRDIVGAYDDLSSQGITQNDKIFIFGYSRGAISARALAQCITNPTFYSEIIKGETLNHEAFPARTVNVLGVFDPVFGGGNISSRPPKHEISAARNQKIKTYIEIAARNEHRILFALRSSIYRYEEALKSHFANQNPLGLRSARRANLSNEQSNRRAFEASRHFIAMSGGHADIGHQMADQVIGCHALLTMLSLSCQSDQELLEGLSTSIAQDAKNFLLSSDDPRPNSSLSSLSLTSRTIRNIGIEFRRRRKITSNKYFLHHKSNKGRPNGARVIDPDYDFFS